MTTNEILILVPALLAGLILGGIFFGGLWWTVQKGVHSKKPARLFFGSRLLRMSMALTGFYFVGREHWQRGIVCLLGFIMARLIVSWLTRPSVVSSFRKVQEANHAS